MKQYAAEAVGTLALVLIGCGTAMLAGTDAANGTGWLLTALAFGLTVTAMAYCIGNISGCHLNPAVSFGMLLSRRMTAAEFLGYITAQSAGALLGSALTALIAKLGALSDRTGSFGANGLDGVHGSTAAGLIIELLLTFFFVLTVLGVTSKKAGHGSFGGLVIGLALICVHIPGIALTGTSVNPARSLGPALVALCTGNAAPFCVLWVFIVGPMAGAALAAGVYGALEAGRR